MANKRLKIRKLMKNEFSHKLDEVKMVHNGGHSKFTVVKLKVCTCSTSNLKFAKSPKVGNTLLHAAVFSSLLQLVTIFGPLTRPPAQWG